MCPISHIPSIALFPTNATAVPGFTPCTSNLRDRNLALVACRVVVGLVGVSEKIARVLAMWPIEVSERRRWVIL